MKYLVKYEHTIIETWEVEVDADSEEEAEAKIHDGDYDYDDDGLVDSIGQKIEVLNIEEVGE